MTHFANQAEWRTYVESEQAALASWLQSHGYTLASEQPHISGERYLMSGRKVVLLALDAAGNSVIIKSSADKTGRVEIELERNRQHKLHTLPFAYYPFRSPKELQFEHSGSRVIFVTEFIEQPTGFLELSTPEQFTIILDVFKTFAGVRATTFSHAQMIKHDFMCLSVHDYQIRLEAFLAGGGASVVQQTLNRFYAEPDTIERYCNFLVHEDFVPHNFRLNSGHTYLIDHSSLQFGNKHETWARFMNFMLLYNPTLEQAFMRYSRDNHASEEQASLTLMRAFKASQLVAFYHQSAKHSDGALRKLSELRVDFWSNAARSFLDGKAITEAQRVSYTEARDQLRSDEERQRQRVLQQLR